MRRAWRRLAVRIHAWTGLLAGPLVVVLGLSGAALVFRPELDALLTGAPPLTGGAVSAPSFDSVLRAALLAHPGGEARALRIAHARRPYRVEIVRGGQRIDVDVDPSTLRVLASRSPERSVLAAVHALHGAFHAGRAGAVVVGLLGVWLLVEGVTGLWLYGRSATPFGGVRRRGASRAMHRLVGAASLAVGLLLGLTGALLALGSVLAPGDSAAASPSPGGLAGLDEVVARVEAASPGARIATVVAEPDRIVRVDVRVATGEARTIHIDRGSGAVTAGGMPPATAWDVVRRLHAGDFAGGLSRTVYAVAGVALAVLAMTGFVIAARRHSSKVLT